MTITSFNTREDFDNLNKQLKFMFDHGLHKVDGAYESLGGLNAENIFKNALGVLKGEMPEASEECEYCRWADESGK